MKYHLRRIATVGVMLLMLFTLVACTDANANVDSNTESKTESIIESITESASSPAVVTTGEAVEGATAIELKDGATQASGGVTVNGDVITITKGGSYALSGTLSDGQVIVDASGAEVTLTLNGVDITCNSSAPVYVKDAKLVNMVLAEGSSNILTDGEIYMFEADSDEPSAALFSKTDLSIDGGGSLSVNANYNNGIQGKDDLVINGGTLVVNAADDGIVGRDSVTISGGKITVTSADDAIKSTNEEDGMGGITVSGGTVNLDAQGDGIQCVGTVSITGGDLQIIAGDGSDNGSMHTGERPFGFGDETDSNADASDDSSITSMKGIKSEVGTIISGGTIFVDSADDTIHSNGSIIISGGTFALASGDDGVHADEQLTIENCEKLDITTSYEGLEAYNISISGGDISIVASDDGINISDPGTETSTTQIGVGGIGGMDADNGGVLTISGGTIRVNAGGDGLDSNGSIVISGGTTIVDGPENAGNGSLDYNGTCTVEGGTLIAAGASGMAEYPSESSEQNFISMTFDSTVSAGSEVVLSDSEGNTVLSYTAAKSFQNIILSSEDILVNGSYTISLNGTDTVTFTASEGATYVNSSGVTTGQQQGGMGGFGGGGGNRGGMTR